MASEQITVLITGANRGIGRGLAEAFLSRPNHTVIAAVRNLDSTLKDYKPAAGSKLLLVKIESSSSTDATDAVQQIRDAGITNLDVVIANAGINPLDALLSVEDMDLDKLRNMFEINTFSFITLFKATSSLLKATADKKGEGVPKVLAITTNVSSLVDMEPNIPAKVGSYGVSKAALNYLVRRAQFENPWLTAWVMNPGFVQSDNGNATAQLFGMPQAPHTIEQSVAGLLAKIDTASRAETSGKFFDFDGKALSF